MSEELKLLPCPACEGEVQIGTIEDDYAPCVYYSATCLCGYHGPKEITKKEAAQQHNLLPRALTWTTEPLTVESWYWARRVSSSGYGLMRIQELSSQAALGRANMELMRFAGSIMFAGPIPMPKEPTNG